MKNIIIILITFLSFTAFGQSYLGGSNNNGPVLTWEDDFFDVGEVKQNNPVTVVFKFKNEGLKPLIIQNVESSCGCTEPEYSKAPVKPLASSEISATFDAKKLGVFSKSITVTSNATEKPKVLIFQGEVVP